MTARTMRNDRKIRSVEADLGDNVADRIRTALERCHDMSGVRGSGGNRGVSAGAAGTAGDGKRYSGKCY